MQWLANSKRFPSFTRISNGLANRPSTFRNQSAFFEKRNFTKIYNPNITWKDSLSPFQKTRFRTDRYNVKVVWNKSVIDEYKIPDLSVLIALLAGSIGYATEDKDSNKRLQVVDKQVEDELKKWIDEEQSKEITEQQTSRIWWDLIISEGGLFVVAILCALGYSLITVSLPAIVGKLIDYVKEVSSKGSADAPNNMLSLLKDLFSQKTTLYAFGLLGLQALFQFVYSSLLSVAAERITAKLKKSVFTSILEKDIAFFDVTSTGELISHVSSDIAEVRSVLKHAVSIGVRSITQIVGGAATLFFISAKLTSVMMILLPSIILTGTVFGRFLQRLSKRSQQASALATGVAQESISNIRTVRAFSNETEEAHRYGRKVDESYELAKKMGIYIAVFQGLSTIALYGSVLFALLYGGTLVSKGELTSGALTSYMLYTFNLQTAMSNLSILQGEVLRGMGAASRIISLMNKPVRIPIHGGAAFDNLRGRIEFCDVSFAYPSRPHVQVFKDISFTIEEGKVYALVGPSGSGKSTIASLIERFYDPLGGSILIDGVDISALDPSWLRKNIAMVSQEPILFATSIKENIAFGKEDSTEEEIEAAAKLANADNFIKKFPNGYDTVVGERGVQLSGGQKQRIAIARAILKNSRIIILDEATSALDTESEHLVQEALQRLTVGRTVVLIAHRLSTVQGADKILVVKDGKIVESGTHEQLLKMKDGVYATLVSKQLVS